MGKVGRWLRSFFVTGRKTKDRADRQADADCQSVSSAAAPSAREKRRWSFRRPAAKVDAGSAQQGQLAPSSSRCFSESEVRVVVVQGDVDRHASAGAVSPRKPPALERNGGGEEGGVEVAAAIKIQSAFRSYLARKALCALRGMVRLQAMVRGQLVRRQASITLRRMQALVDAQRHARDERLRLLHEDDDARQLAAPTPPSLRSPKHARSRKPLLEENVKTVEVDDGGDAPSMPCARSGSGSCGGYSTPTRAEIHQMPSPSALTDTSAQTLSGRFEDASPNWQRAWHADHAPPRYMANTESSRARARSQSAPRQRLSLSALSESATAANSPSPSCRGARRRASLDPLDLLGARAAAQWSGSGCVERCASRTRASAGAALHGSACRSSAWRD